jgi:predicted dehydrogenase
MPKYRSAVIGCGGRSYGHANAYRLVERGALAACCDLRPEAREAYAARCGLRAYADAAEMLEREKPDLVHLVTWPESRVELMSLVEAAGVPACIVEKPIACQVADWKQLVALEARARTKFAVCHQLRWHASLSACRRALASGKLGRLLFLDFTARFNISGQGTHILDYAMSLNEDAPAVRVFGAASGTEEMASGHPGPDTTVAQVQFANGVWGCWSTGHASPKAIEEDTPWKHVRVAAYAERGRMLYEEFGKWEIASPAGVEGGQVESMEHWTQGNDQAQAAMIEAMFDWLEDDSRPAGTHLKKGLHQWQVVLALYASALWRRPVELPFDPPEDLFRQLGEALRGA